MSATPYSTLANSEQRIADLERQLAEREAELAECKAERDEALEQQTATAAVLQVINSSPGDLAPVFDAILEKAHTLCSAEYGGLATYDGEYFRLVAARGYPEDLVEALRRPFHGNFSHQQLLRGERYVHIEDVLALPEMTDVAGRATQEGGFRTVLMVPLRKDGTLLGHISASRQEVRPFTEKQIALLQNFAAQAVIAMENARLITETREALEQQTATAEVLQVINSSPGDPAPVFDAILEKAHSLCGTASGSLHITDGDGFRAVSVRGVSGSFADVLRQPMRPGPNHPVWRAIAGELFVQIPNVSEIDDLRLQDGAKGGFRTVLLVPLRKEELFLGYIIASRREVRPFSDKQIALLQNFAAQAVIAMENARLLGELHQRTDQVAELNRGLEARVAEQVEELGRVGRLKRFLAPQLAELIVSQGDEKILESHRREIVVVFCDLRGYTAFAETADPEDNKDVPHKYHRALGPRVSQFERMLDQS